MPHNVLRRIFPLAQCGRMRIWDGSPFMAGAYLKTITERLNFSPTLTNKATLAIFICLANPIFQGLGQVKITKRRGNFSKR